MSALVPDVSIVVPVYRNAATLPALHRQVCDVMDRRGCAYEFLFVDDASPDESPAVLRDLPRTRPVAVITMLRNVGQHRAVWEGLRQARGRTVVVLDADLQDPPAAIPLLLDRLRDGVAIVYAARSGQFESPFRLLTSRWFRRGLRRLAGIPTTLGLFSAMDRRLVDQLVAAAPERPFFPAMVVQTGLPMASVPVQRLPRPVGRSAYTTWKRVRLGALGVAATLRWHRPEHVKRPE